jgi:hypothetical protein
METGDTLLVTLKYDDKIRNLREVIDKYHNNLTLHQGIHI